MEFLIKRIPNVLLTTGIPKNSKFLRFAFVNYFHNGRVLYDKDDTKLPMHLFTGNEKKKSAYLDVIHRYTNEPALRKKQVEFILYAMKFMDEYGVNKDIEVYKALLNVFPKGEYVTTSRYQILHYPKQQDTALRLLSKMEENRVMPDYEMQELIINIFGIRSWPARKYAALAYWMAKFHQLNPWPIPDPPPTDHKVLGQYALKKMASMDVLSKITEYKTTDVPGATEDTWILSTMSRTQEELLAVQPTDQSLFVEGPFNIWIGNSYLHYFVLKGDPIKREIIYDSADDVSNLQIPFWEKLHNKIPVTDHEQDDGVYYAMCITGTSSKDSLLSWIRCLQIKNPVLHKIPITFKIKSETSTEHPQIEAESDEIKALNA
ncbi:evolutionarily conserved signaling intermediate in Toll pathway, mitochondrial [Nomia melanderi]|uniref:evolutionarily conserved signaling intermediate in Toll pathway, mitochondrial n=1 Tax=Nomia melanderi TaxID=2448451 RepID=UPI00130458FA|nr:evolutionarily conserved signaling intermediate in Toll pathway, mitochondrial [Nomia melanderi]